jgi:hypothetical protein
MVKQWIWIGVVVCLLSGCAHSQKIKVVSDISSDGDVTYHTEYIAEF